MLIKWVGQAWRELHANNNKSIYQTFCKLGLCFVVNGSKDKKLLIKDLLEIVVGNWRLTYSQINKQQVEKLVKIDKSIIEAGDSSISGINIKYVSGSNIDIESKLQVDKKNDNNEMKDNDLSNCNLKDNELSKMEWIQIFLISFPKYLVL